MNAKPRPLSLAWIDEHFDVFHLLVSSAGFLALVNRAAFALVAAIQSPFPIVFNQWARPFYFPEKRIELYAYVLTAAALLAYYIAAYFLVRHRVAGRTLRDFGAGKGWLAAYLAFALIVNALLCYMRTAPYPRSMLVGAVWVVLTIAPFVPSWLDYWRTENEDSRPLYRAIWIVVCLQLAAIFLPFLGNQPKLINEFFDIPEQTLIDGHYVDNKTFIDEHDALGLPGYKYSPAASRSEDAAAFEVKVPHSMELEEFIASRNEEQLNYVYDARRGMLQLVSSSITKNDVTELGRIVDDSDVERAIAEVYRRLQDRQRAFKQKTYTEQEREFIRRNELEVVRQMENRWVLHHHNFTLGPVAQLAAGRPLDEIFMQYGLLNTVGMKVLLEATGGISLQNYFRTWYSFYPLYFALYVALVFYLFRGKLPYVLSATALAAAVLNFIGFQYLLLGPGLNPIRHLHDILVLWALFLYFRRRSLIWLVAAGIATVLGVVNNSATGIFSAAAFVVTCIAMIFPNGGRDRWRQAAVLAITAAGSAYAFAVSKAAFDPMTKYYLSGLLGFPVDARLVLALLSVASLGYMVLLLRRASTDPIKFIALYLLLYSQTLLVYFVWAGTMYHFLNMGAIYALALVALAYLWIEDVSVARTTANTMKCAAVALVLLLYLPTIGVYYNAKRQYDWVFATHKVHQWPFDQARVLSTADPSYFEASVSLIRKYAPGNRIYIISKYDYIVPFLAGKYSGLPYFDLGWFLLTKREIENSIRAIADARPEYLFVDADIDRALASDVISSEHPVFGSLHKESVLRVARLSKLRDVFEAVRADYEPLERGVLLSAYKRK